MKYWSLFIVLFLLVSFQEQQVSPPELGVYTSTDKDFLLDYFDETEDRLEDITDDLSGPQLAYKSAEDRWSISQVLEHIVLTEQALFKMTEELMAKEAAPERRSEIKASDEELISGVVDRSQKFQAPPDLQPTGKYADPEVALDDLEEQRKASLDFIKNTPEVDMRNHISDSPFGPIDVYQSLL